MKAQPAFSHTGRYNYVRPGLRFCEHCGQYKPRGKRAATKTWRCEECVRAEAVKVRK